MSFNKVIILDWYDNIVNAFCMTDSNLFFYCNLLAIDNSSDIKIYVSIELNYFKHSKEILDIIKQGSFLKDEGKLGKLLNVIKMPNESWLIKTKDLNSNDQLEIIRYKNNFNWNKNIFFIDYLETLAKTKEIDNWWSYWSNT